MLTDLAMKLLNERGLDGETLARFGVESVARPGNDSWIRIPYFQAGVIVNNKYRTLAGEKKFNQDSNAKKVFWNRDVISDPSLRNEPLIITEGELDALAAIQAGFVRVVSVPDGAPPQEVAGKSDSKKYSFVNEALADLQQCTEIILATDADGPGRALMEDLAILIGRVRCKWVNYPAGCKDLNDILFKIDATAVLRAVHGAQWIDVPGVYSMDELPPLPQKPVFPLNMPVIDNHYKIRPMDFCVVTGIPSHGKSSWLNEVAARMALQYGWVTCFASFEQEPQTDHKRNLRTYFNRKRVIQQSEDEIYEADQWINKQFCFIVPGYDDDITLSWLLERAAVAVVRYGAKMVIVDPWNEMDHTRPPDMTLTEYTGFAIKQFKAFARKYKVHVIVAAHPAKMHRDKMGDYPIPSLYDISDSAHWANKADVGIVIWRGMKGETPISLIKITKSKFHDQIGIPGDVEVSFSIEDNHYTVTDMRNY